jgi:hypothetical protein
MVEEAGTPDLVELTRRSMEGPNLHRFDAASTMFAPHVVFDMSAAGLGRFEGEPAARRYLEDWLGLYQEQSFGEWRGEHLGGGVVLVVARLDARPIGSRSTVHERWAFTVVWEGGMIERVVAAREVRQAREQAQRLAQERA